MASFTSKAQLITAICQQIHTQTSKEQENLHTFTYHFFRRAPIEAIQRIAQEELVFIIRHAWMLFQQRQPLQSIVEIRDYHLAHQASPRSGIFMVNLDQPFLIDSIIAFLEKKEFKIELMVHPVLGVQRSAEGALLSLVDLKETHPAVTKPQAASSGLGTQTEKETPLSLPLLDSSSTPYYLKEGHHPESFVFIQIKAHLKKKQIVLLQKEIDILLAQIRNVVFDWPIIRNHLKKVGDHIENLPLIADFPSSEERRSLIEFLNWLEQGYFVFLGSRYFAAEPEQPASSSLTFSRESASAPPCLGLFRDNSFAHSDDLVPGFSRSRPFANNRIPSKDFLLSITKTNARSTVHRVSRIDSIEVIDWNPEGKPRGLYQFIGVFTQLAYAGSAFETPIVRHKVGKVFNQFGLAPEWHDGKTLMTILNSIPRDELFYLDHEQIFEFSQNVLNMNDQHSLTLLVRSDIYGRYTTVMIFLPKEKYSSDVIERFRKILEHHLKGKISSDKVLLGELDYARLIFVVSAAEPSLVSFNKQQLEKDLLEAALSWEDQLERLLADDYDEKTATTLLARYQKAFSIIYMEEFMPSQAARDIGYIEKITDTAPVKLYLYLHKDHKTLKAKIFHKHHSLSLSTLLPILQNLGLQVIAETSYLLKIENYSIWIHDFEIHSQGMDNWQMNHDSLTEAFYHIWQGTAENDSLHQLILKANLNVRQVTLIRAYLKFLRQLQLPYSLGYMEETLANHPELTRHFVNLFELRFSLRPAKTHSSAESQLLKDIRHLVDKVERLDHDRILRYVLNAIEATVRTNYFQTLSQEGSFVFKPYLSFKFACHKLDDLPQPRPLYEIFVYSSHMEAVHLRGAKVARGGIRWSERPEDFRTEVLGLMKAQTLKNAVIVPLGSKGGFVVKNQNKITDPAKLREEVIACYKMMMRGLLDITDNLVEGKVVHPPQVVCLDEEDPYLVVAADKGTATFSDIANGIAEEYGFWLNDAFASGGSAGYDHKKIAITSRGVWESVKRHFRELGHDCQTTPSTVAGVGDMSGDIFGNGMLRSRKIRLLAAFNHQHIFLDPDPDCEISFQERQRLFEMPQSTWKHYNPALISPGGGVFDRAVKSIPLDSAVRKAFAIQQVDISPDELIQHLLCLPVDLLYFGGIGTFVKASLESHAEAGDRDNNDIRVDAKKLRARVIAEGANLGMTQRARIEYALNGGRLNTDAIDNSGGVDCSDHEVNLKILFRTLSPSLSTEERNTLLKEMTEDLIPLILADNYRQTQTLSVLEAGKSARLNAYQSLMHILEKDAGLNRSLEALPEDDVLERRRIRNQAMTRPELSVLLGYAKIALHQKLLASSLPDEPGYRRWLHHYFPLVMQQRFVRAIDEHPLSREITATVLANEMINRVGPTFAYEIAQTCGSSEVTIVKAFFMACEVLNLLPLWMQIDNLDSLMVADAQTSVLLDINQSLEQIVLWFIRHPHARPSSFTGLDILLAYVPETLQGEQRLLLEARTQAFVERGIPPHVARNLSLIPLLLPLLDIMFLSRKNQDHVLVAQIYFDLHTRIGLDTLMAQLAKMQGDFDWQRSARLNLIDDLAQIQAKLTTSVMGKTRTGTVEKWMQKNKERLSRLRPVLATVKNAGHADLGMVSYAMRHLQRLAD